MLGNQFLSVSGRTIKRRLTTEREREDKKRRKKSSTDKPVSNLRSHESRGIKRVDFFLADARLSQTH